MLAIYAIIAPENGHAKCKGYAGRIVNLAWF